MDKELEFTKELHDLYYKVIKESSISEYEKTDQLFLLEFRMLSPFKAIMYILNLIKNSLIPYVKNTFSVPMEKKVRLKMITDKYNEAVLEYQELQNKESTLEEKQALLNKVMSIKQDIEEYGIVGQSNYPVQPGDEIDSGDYSSEGPSGSSMVGPVTDMIDQSANVEWRKYWKTRCGRFKGVELNRCKAKGVDRALVDIKSKISHCDSTVDPIGCRNTVQRMIDEWKTRKVNYTIKR